jgi:alpha-D-ribose 1-methylphosphonate 5-triphosphate synthase subunit PhnG
MTVTAPADQDYRARQRWMAVLARTPLQRMADTLAGLPAVPAHVTLRKPEIGSALVRARAGGDGQRFNLGEMTVTRCSVRLENGAVGHAYLAGRRPREAELAALLDALLQDPDQGPLLEARLIGPMAEALEAARRRRAGDIAASRVTFFTMARGED